MAKFAVETLFTYGFENCWKEPDGTPTLFNTREEAEQEMKDHITDCINAVEAGDMEDSPDPSELRVVEVNSPPHWTTVVHDCDALEIHPCAVLHYDHPVTGEKRECAEVCEAKDADFWTVYGHYRSGGVEAFEDFPTEWEAVCFHDELLASYPHLQK